MKVITLQELERDFDAIMEDIGDNKAFYRLQTEQGDFMLVPYEEYSVLADTYQEWVDDKTIDPFPLPIQYVGDAQPEDLNQKSQVEACSTEHEDCLDPDNWPQAHPSFDANDWPSAWLIPNLFDPVRVLQDHTVWSLFNRTGLDWADQQMLFHVRGYDGDDVVDLQVCRVYYFYF